uniref:Translation initiation factor 3 N-terminal domain-containing protein n=1 Tax=Odontella aurita TaxID=265563 RepID=A0A7S4MV73_9STRA|mmetsp:Transcript_3448/g.8990  ORF Transcript_3448/g.8990 Transcript_3448/m.8990 type:complete len:279 (+) Transcript_3448:267-1103(+)
MEPLMSMLKRQNLVTLTSPLSSRQLGRTMLWCSQQRGMFSICNRYASLLSAKLAVQGSSSTNICRYAYHSIGCGRNNSMQAYLQSLPVTPSVTASLTQMHRPSFSRERTFASKGKKRKGKGGKQDRGPLANEHLVSYLLRRGGGKSAESLQVRLAIDHGAGSPSDIEVVSLVGAIETSQGIGVDLVGISVDQDIPVVKAVDLNKLKYDQSKKSSPSSSNASKQVKEFKFKVRCYWQDSLMIWRSESKCSCFRLNLCHSLGFLCLIFLLCSHIREYCCM